MGRKRKRQARVSRSHAIHIGRIKKITGVKFSWWGVKLGSSSLGGPWAGKQGTEPKIGLVSWPNCDIRLGIKASRSPFGICAAPEYRPNL